MSQSAGKNISRRSGRVQLHVKLTVLGLLAFVGMTVPTESQSFGPAGHRVVGQIASTHLSPEAARGVANLLDGESLAEAATWPDEIRSDPAWSHASPWHYVTIEDGETYKTSTKDPDGDVVKALNDHIATLESLTASKGDKVIALRWVVHLVGDVHQPLHVGRGGDRGGNSIDVKWFGESKNLHSVWDSGLIDSTQLSFSELASFVDDATPPQVGEWQRSTVDDWVRESIGYREQVYSEPGPDFRDSYRYAYQNLPLIEMRLVQAGVRLAGVLNNALGSTNAWLDMPNGLHWVRNSAEYNALAYQTYADAKAELAKLRKAGSLPAAGTWAVALDADETVLDNSLYQKEEMNKYDSSTWKAWVEREEAGAVPGAVDFLKFVRAVGGKIAIVSNRRINVQAATEANLKKLDAPFDIVLLQDTTGEKEPRWDSIEDGSASANLGRLEILMYLGDNITDFPDLDQDQRFADADSFARFGTSYFVLPNPVYGSWRGNARK